MAKGMCCRCYDEDVEVVPAPCAEKPENQGELGMYHCPDCGAMVLGGFPHGTVCIPCSKQEREGFDPPKE